jgi:CBS-domain-containing membrane protein
MGTTVGDYMNPQLVYMRTGSRPGLARQQILDFGITAVPVLDEDDRPVGLLALRDLLDPHRREAGLTSAALLVERDETIAAAARKLADASVHHLVVVDGQGRAVGMLSSLDVIRGLAGLAPKHPEAIDSFGRMRIDAETLTPSSAAAG